MNQWNPNEYRPWLDEAGLTVTHLALVPKDMTHEGPERTGRLDANDVDALLATSPNGVAATVP